MSEPATSDTDAATLRVALQALAAELGKTPTVVDMHEEGDYHPEVYIEVFGSWDAALKAAGLNPADIGTKKYPDTVLLDELQRLAQDLGRPPTQQDMNEHGEYSDTTYQQRFGSWNNALQEAMLGTNELSERELIRELQRLAKEVERMPKVADMADHGKYAPVTYYRRFGSWLDALDEADLLR